jgi:glycosyltransferase involved in cell wall biosynthesis
VASLSSLSFVLPALNEQANIGRAVAAAIARLDGRLDAGEVIVIDDGSTDATAALVSAHAAADPRVRLIRHGRRRGYGAALRTGFAAARFDWVLVWDADGQFDLADLDRLAAQAGIADVVVGRRALRRDPRGRVVLGALWSALVRGALGVRVRDVDCGFKLLRRSLLAELPLRASGAAISAEILCHAARAGGRIVEVDVRHLPRAAGRATGAEPAVALRGLAELARLAITTRRRKVGQRDLSVYRSAE